ncbi:hypothetical protein L1987_54132 [Smallanthus sonchifolius]|uniref:Uncharacterized protein n=1 Tax=Smallanthus sonchifolius TaxID=185202 RepID=A0ACB9E676_9ASTR|nr:hypothetical protein L1987_54132 [Smallanthus sonchifolius]
MQPLRFTFANHHCEDIGYGVPCVFVAAKDDLDSYPMATRDSEAALFDLENAHQELKSDFKVCAADKAVTDPCLAE